MKKECDLTDWSENSVYGSIRQTMIDEGNNCVFLSKYVRNVAIRWNKDYHITKFISNWSKREPEKSKKDENSQVISEVIIETTIDGGFADELIKF